jgi:ribosome biogenesis GTPase / thiamine phosphate phosphatase
MLKRHLSLQQKTRIQALQDSRTGVVMRVSAQLGRELEITNEAGDTFPAKLRQNLPPIVTGDWVLGSQATPPVVIEQLLPRTNLIERPAKSGKRKAIAANVDQALLVIAPVPEASLLMIDRYLVQLHAQDLPMILVVNKADLGIESLLAMIDLYRGLGYTVLTVSTQFNTLEDLPERLEGKTSLVLGQSGVGKSSLIHAIDPSIHIRIGDLSQSEQGKHTTTTTRLYTVGDAEIIDSPGVYDIASWHLSPEQLRQGFIEINAQKHACQFNDCTHTHEPVCGVKTAVEANTISASRYKNYCYLLNE